MEIHQVQYFMALCQSLNFTRAADACGVTQPSLTKAIKKLEDELGGPLFRRERGLTHLTDLGRLMRPHLEAVFNASEMARHQAECWRKLDHAPLRVGLMCTIGPGRMVEFLKRVHHDLPNVEVTLKDAPGREVVRLLMEGELDVAFVGLPDLPDRCDHEALYRERYTVAFAPGHRFEAMDRVPYQELQGEDYLSRVNCEYPDHFSALGLPDTVDVRVCYATEREDWVQALILAGMGCAVMPEYLPILPGIATRVIVEPEIARDIRLVTVSGRRHSPALRAFIALAKRHPWIAGG
ncbi:LysR family transcriptional regulator [Azospirillum griseum]|uniref:LysR family transcriptional regulator n=1 Tax=Azospirillum griseum TaxID=2496639 RepID=A0A431VI24_9PROT|nr:LysR family transcriptional regulator [Azospirillum griseum]RTR21005.1 LysR family transcriptional regulator [Azospirillum griseum]